MIVTNTNVTPDDPWLREGQVDSWPIFSIGVRRLEAGASAAVATGWQYMSHTNNTGQLLSDYVRGAGAVERTEDILSRKTQLAYERLVSLSQAKERAQIWEVRSLRIQALYLHAMWLHSLSGEQDVVIPYLSYFPELREMEQYPLSLFLQVARREASRLPRAPAA